MLALALSACVNLPVPGGTSELNSKCFKSVADMQAQVAKLQPGMPEKEVLASLCGKKETMTRLDRRDIRIALLGGDNVLFSRESNAADSQIIESLYGYQMEYKDTKKRHGFSSPIRIQTNESGFDYTITLIFKNGALFEKPILSGGLVNDTKSGTIFDFITPGTVIDKAIP